jgi:hypothetical protein
MWDGFTVEMQLGGHEKMLSAKQSLSVSAAW